MFDYPFSIPSGTIYDQLGIGPEADSHEVSEAKVTLLGQLHHAKDEAESALRQVFDQVKGLRAACDLVATLQAKGRDASLDALQKSQVELAHLEREAEKVNPDFKKLRERVSQLESEISAVNLMKILDVNGRREYDRSHPPLELLKLTDPRRDVFTTDQTLTLPLLRRELSKFFDQQGEEVFHPTDLTRDDFSGDFTYVDLLDGDEA